MIVISYLIAISHSATRTYHRSNA